MASLLENPLSKNLSLSTQDLARTERPHSPPTLTTLPREIPIEIYSLSCKYESDIKPEFRNGCNGSGGFKHLSGDECYICFFKHFKNSEDQARDTKLALTAMSLALTCRSISALVLGDLIFYKINSFAFEDTRVFIEFMQGINLEKTKAIQSIKLESCGWPAGVEFKSLPFELWENVRNFELQLVVFNNREEHRYANIIKWLPHQCYRNLKSVTILYWSALKHRFSWHLTRKRAEPSQRDSQLVRESRHILKKALLMTNVDRLVTEITSDVTDQWDGACKITAECNFPIHTEATVP